MKATNAPEADAADPQDVSQGLWHRVSPRHAMIPMRLLVTVFGSDGRLDGRRRGSGEPAQEVSRQPATPPTSVPKDTEARSDAQTSPMRPLLEEAKQMIAHLENDIHDYSAIIGKRERVGDKLSDYQFMFLKIRQKPLSVFLHFLTPDNVKGDEAILRRGTKRQQDLGPHDGPHGSPGGHHRVGPQRHDRHAGPAHIPSPKSASST